MTIDSDNSGLPNVIDLASRQLGGTVMACSDEAFGPMEALLHIGTPACCSGNYNDRGEIVDGWETRRRRSPGSDWALIRLGAPGIIASVDIDTTYFSGNYPDSCVVEACGQEGYPNIEELNSEATEWTEIIGRSVLAGNAHNTFRVASQDRFTHVRLRIYPDGGVARLRVLGRAITDPSLLDGMPIDLSAQQYGGMIEAASNEFYTTASILNLPGSPNNMGDGWETQRRRKGDGDWVRIRLMSEGVIDRIEVDTTHFKYNAPASFSLQTSVDARVNPGTEGGETIVLSQANLLADTRHFFRPVYKVATQRVLLELVPDGGLSRVRLWGTLTKFGRVSLGLQWINALPMSQLASVLAGDGKAERGQVQHVGQYRPFGGLSELEDACRGLFDARRVMERVEGSAR